MRNGFFEAADLYPHSSADTEQEALDIHFGFLTSLLEKRVQSLSAYFLRPPIRWAGALNADGRLAALQMEKLKAEWDLVLQGEQMLASGKTLKCLEAVHSLRNNVTRAIALAAEHSADAALDLLKFVTCHIGDTAVIENTHQQAKDILRDSRHNVRSRLCKMHAVISSNAVNARNIPHIKVSDEEKVDRQTCKVDGFNSLTHPNTHVSAGASSIFCGVVRV